jgi:hypothetical protein
MAAQYLSLRRKIGVHIAVIDQEAIVISFETGKYFCVRSIGADVVAALNDGALTAEELAAWVAATYGPGFEEGLAGFVAELLREGIAEQVAGDPGVRGELKTVHGEDNVVGRGFFLEPHSELADVITLDPVHEISQEGWPHKATT